MSRWCFSGESLLAVRPAVASLPRPLPCLEFNYTYFPAAIFLRSSLYYSRMHYTIGTYSEARLPTLGAQPAVVSDKAATDAA